MKSATAYRSITMQRNRLLLILILSAGSAQADSVSVNGFSCFNEQKNPISVTGYVENAQQNRDGRERDYYSANETDEIRAGFTIRYEWGSQTKPLDCNQLYQLELTRLRIEIERLQALKDVKPEWIDTP